METSHKDYNILLTEFLRILVRGPIIRNATFKKFLTHSNEIDITLYNKVYCHSGHDPSYVMTNKIVGYCINS